MLMGLGCPCPPVRNDIVTPRHLFISFYLRDLNLIAELSSSNQLTVTISKLSVLTLFLIISNH